MKVIYEPKGKAREYAPLAVNLYTGCSHRCAYCYVPQVLHMDREKFHSNVQVRDKILVNLEKDCLKLKLKYQLSSTPHVFMCFTCDPYDPTVDNGFTRDAIEIINEVAGLPVRLLTKNPTERDFDILAKNMYNSFGITLTGAPPEIEPDSMPEFERIEVLESADLHGIHTWVSMEPIWDVERCLLIIRSTCDFTDMYRVGKLNYHPHAKEIDWKDALVRIEAALKEVCANHVIKRDLEAYRK